VRALQKTGKEPKRQKFEERAEQREMDEAVSEGLPEPAMQEEAGGEFKGEREQASVGRGD